MLSMFLFSVSFYVPCFIEGKQELYLTALEMVAYCFMIL